MILVDRNLSLGHKLGVKAVTLHRLNFQIGQLRRGQLKRPGCAFGRVRRLSGIPMRAAREIALLPKQSLAQPLKRRQGR